MKQKRQAGLIDLITLDSLDEIREMAQNAVIDRRLDTFRPLVNGILLHHLLGILSFRGRRFPTMSAKSAPGRAAEQDQLWETLNARSGALREGPIELEALARWIRGIGNEKELGRLVQQAVGSQFDASYRATEETWKAALTLEAALQTKNPWKLLAWGITGKIRNAKRVLASKVGEDLAAVHGTGVALHNIVRALERMENLYANVALRSSLPSEEVIRRCLSAPASVMRQATSAGKLGGCPFRKGTLFVVALAEAQKASGADELVFMKDTWSRCPAEQWVPSLLTGIWKRATAIS
ncbi:MAG: hypothetical protein WBY53_20020 [Acidobacteriaceae bacterium]